jgi:hypothetical protein
MADDLTPGNSIAMDLEVSLERFNHRLNQVSQVEIGWSIDVY